MSPNRTTTKRFKIYEELRDKIYEQIISHISLEELERDEPHSLRERLISMAREGLNNAPVTFYEREKIIDEIVNEITGYGPLEPLLKDEGISDILVNGPGEVFVERRGRIETSEINFKNKDHLMHVIRKLAGAAGRRIDESNPMVDAYLSDGSRVNAIVPPIAVAPSLSIRKFVKSFVHMRQLIEIGSLSTQMSEFLDLCVEGKLNILISGGTGSGKTTLLGVISKCIPDEERLVTIEDSLELSISKPNVVRLVSRPPNVEGKGEIIPRQLVINSLRMRPDRIIVGEVRGPEVWDMLQAMNTGHAGSFTTVHANSALDALYRIQTMAMLAGYEISESTLKTVISRCIDIVVHMSRFMSGDRKIVQISEIAGTEGNSYVLNDVYSFSPDTGAGSGSGRFDRLCKELSPKLRAKLVLGGMSREAMDRHFSGSGLECS